MNRQRQLRPHCGFSYHTPTFTLSLPSLISTLSHSLSALPVLALADDIAKALTTGNVLLRAEPGAGKSTGLPLALLVDANLGGRIILLEPRRLAARSVAERLADHLGEKVGQRVGLRMRADTRISAATRLEVVTEGVLTRLLQEDPGLTGIGLLIFDEFHERSLHADLGLALSLEVQQALRPDLRLLLMSATLEAEQLSTHLRDITQFHCTVRQHPVETIYVGEHGAPLPQRVARTVLDVLKVHRSDVLVFLPGAAEINRTAALLQPGLDTEVVLHRLHGGVSQAAQNAATAAATPLTQRVILATSLAETSVTIDGVGVVVDAGLERRGRLDSSTGAQRLETVMASQASATQRAGRAGRTAAGTCYRLWSESGHARRPPHWQPEIRRADLAPLLMELGMWGASGCTELPWLEPPPAASLARAETLLTRLGLWQAGQLTPHGRKVAALPVHPRLGHMLMWAVERDATSIACRLATWLDEQRRGKDSVDLEPCLNQDFPSALQQRAARLARRLGKPETGQLPDLKRKTGDPQHMKRKAGRVQRLELEISEPTSAAAAPSAAVVLAQAYPDWIAQRRPGEPGRFLLACGAGATVPGDDPLSHCPWLAVAELGGAGSQARIFKAMSLDIDELQRFSPEHFATHDHLGWDDRQERVLAEHRLMLGSLMVDTRPMQHISDADRASALIAGIRLRGLACLPWNDECREWQARVQRMPGLSMPGGMSHWPAVDDGALIDRLDAWLLPFLQGVRSMKALQQLNLYQPLSAMLDYHQQALMDEWLPGRYAVPSGSLIRLTYIEAGNPVLSVRLQEMLGHAENPSIANGQIRLKVELLSPARRPVQITEDLANFWTNSYPAVKKEMAGRYPRHVWPDDPLSARPTAQAKRRR